MHNLFLVFCILHSAFCILACSVPNLETPQCTEARDAVKRFYSFHFGNDMRRSTENVRKSEQFLTIELKDSLLSSGETARDYFTATEDYPKAFRVGSCTSESGNKATLQVLLFWRDDVRSEQKAITVDVIKQSDKWLIDNIR